MAWLAANVKKAKNYPLLASCTASGILVYACLKGTHFVGAHNVIGEGNRTYKNIVDGRKLKLNVHDVAGAILQKKMSDLSSLL